MGDQWGGRFLQGQPTATLPMQAYSHAWAARKCVAGSRVHFVADDDPPVMSPISPLAWKMVGFSNTKSALPLAPVRDLLSRTSGIVGSAMPLMNWRLAASQEMSGLLVTGVRRKLGEVEEEKAGLVWADPLRMAVCILSGGRVDEATASEVRRTKWEPPHPDSLPMPMRCRVSQSAIINIYVSERRRLCL